MKAPAPGRQPRWPRVVRIAGASPQALVPFGDVDVLRALRQAFEYFENRPCAPGRCSPPNAKIKAALSFARPAGCARAPTPTAAPGA